VPTSPSAAVVIANWNGGPLLTRCLSSVAAAVRRAGCEIPVLLVDDASEDGSADVAERRFPSVRLLRLPRNVGFAQAVNQGIGAADAPWVFLLNNDLVLPPDFLSILLEVRRGLPEEDLFALGALTLAWDDGRPNHGAMRARWARGMIVQEPFEATCTVPADFFQAGACLVSREKFLELGGFDPLFHPGYWEDYDLAYRARRRGWRCFHVPQAIAFHWGKRSMVARLGAERVALLIRRNQLLFNWVNLDDPTLLARHLLGLPRLILRPEPSPEPSSATWARAFVAALARLGPALRDRRRRLRRTPVSDRQILFSPSHPPADAQPPLMG